jgi:uroporphyrinogen-III synthase
MTPSHGLTQASQALAGRRIIVTRPRAQSDDFVRQLEAHGASAVVCPASSIRPIADSAPLDRALRDLRSFHWLVFTSANAVTAVMDRVRALGLSSVDLRDVRIAVVGDATADALERVGMQPSLRPADFDAASLARSLGDVRGLRLLLPRSNIAGRELPALLRQSGGDVVEVMAYETVPDDSDAGLARVLRDEGADAITFASPSAVRASVEAIGGVAIARDLLAGPRRPTIVCIGPSTELEARAAGLAVDVVAKRHDVSGMVDALVDWFGRTENLNVQGRL